MVGCVVGLGMFFWLTYTDRHASTNDLTPPKKPAPLPNGGLGEEEVGEVLRMRQTPDLYKRLAER